MSHVARSSILAAALLLAASCKKDEKGKPEDKQAGAASSKTTESAAGATDKAAPPAADPIKAIEGCWNALSTWDKDAFRACYPEVTSVQPMDAVPPEEPYTSQKDQLVHAGVFRNAFPDFKADVQLIMVNGKKAVAIGIVSGTHKGRSLGIPPTNKPISMFHAQVLELDEQGRIAKQRDYGDQATMLAQLGLLQSGAAPTAEKPWDQKVRAVAKDDATEKANLAAIKQSFEGAAAKADVAATTAKYADDAQLRYAFLNESINGKKQIAAVLKDYFGKNKDVQVSLGDAWAAGDWVAAETSTKGTLAVDMAGIKGTSGKSWSYSSLELFQLAGGKVKQHYAFFNSLKFSADVGIFDPSSLGE